MLIGSMQSNLLPKNFAETQDDTFQYVYFAVSELNLHEIFYNFLQFTYEIYTYKFSWISMLNIRVSRFVKRKTIPRLCRHGGFEYSIWRISSVFVFLCPSVFQKLSTLSKN